MSAIPGMTPAARLGVWLGFHGWLIGVAVLAGANGEFKLLGQACLIGIPLSSALSIVTLHLVAGAQDRRTYGRRLAGAIFFGIGVLLIVINHWLAPMIAGDDALERTMERLGGTYATSDIVPAAFLFAAVLALWKT
ncbi:MAG: hypothetical protein ACYTHK_01475 [Planctomycetota bacterium]|jgi:hypothetical protein